MDVYSQYLPPWYSHKTSPAGRLTAGIITDNKGHVSNPNITLRVRQEPKEALVTPPGKEKGRKPVDPPPIVQLEVSQEHEASQHFLQSPYLFMVATLWQADKDEPWDGPNDESLYGSLTSSLHRLKDLNNKDGGFFIFGDIAVRTVGTFRLNFSVYDMQTEIGAACFLGSVLSQPFTVHPPKDFRGLEESTYLSRAFSDQGVRLRLRKEPRVFTGHKRSFYSDGVQSARPTETMRTSSSFYEDDASPSRKRVRADTEDRQENYPEHVAVTQSNFASSYTPTPPTSFPTSSYTPTTPASFPASSYASISQTAYAPSYTSLPQSNYAPQYFSPPYSRQPALQPAYMLGHYHSNHPLGSMSHLSNPESIPSSLTQYPELRAGSTWNPDWRGASTSEPQGS